MMKFITDLLQKYFLPSAEKLIREYDQKIGDKPTIFNKEVERQTGITGVLYVERIEQIMFLSKEQAIQLIQSIDNNNYIQGNKRIDNTSVANTLGMYLTVEKAHTAYGDYLCVFYWGDVGNIHVVHWKKIETEIEKGDEIIDVD